MALVAALDANTQMTNAFIEAVAKLNPGVAVFRDDTFRNNNDLRRPGDKRQVYFIAETKGTSDETKLRMEESAKIACARKHFAAICGVDVTYDVVKDYQELLNKVMGA